MCTDLYSVLSRSTHLTDRHTESFLIAIPHVHYMQCGKNGWPTRTPNFFNFRQQCYTMWIVS